MNIHEHIFTIFAKGVHIQLYLHTEIMDTLLIMNNLPAGHLIICK